MPVKSKLIGIILIVVGALPFLAKITAVSEFIAKYSFLESITPGNIVYQAIIIILGILLVWKLKHSVHVGTSR